MIEGAMPVSLVRSSWIDPSPVPVDTVIEYVLPDPLMAVIEAPVIPLVINKKFDAVRPIIICAVFNVKFADAVLVKDDEVVVRERIEV